MKCKYWNREVGQYDEQCQCSGEVPSTEKLSDLNDKTKMMLHEAIHLLMNNYHHKDPDWIEEYEKLCKEYEIILC